MARGMTIFVSQVASFIRPIFFAEDRLQERFPDVGLSLSRGVGAIFV